MPIAQGLEQGICSTMLVFLNLNGVFHFGSYKFTFIIHFYYPFWGKFYEEKDNITRDKATARKNMLWSSDFQILNFLAQCKNFGNWPQVA